MVVSVSVSSSALSFLLLLVVGFNDSTSNFILLCASVWEPEKDNLLFFSIFLEILTVHVRVHDLDSRLLVVSLLGWMVQWVKLAQPSGCGVAPFSTAVAGCVIQCKGGTRALCSVI